MLCSNGGRDPSIHDSILEALGVLEETEKLRQARSLNNMSKGQLILEVKKSFESTAQCILMVKTLHGACQNTEARFERKAREMQILKTCSEAAHTASLILGAGLAAASMRHFLPGWYGKAAILGFLGAIACVDGYKSDKTRLFAGVAFAASAVECSLHICVEPLIICLSSAVLGIGNIVSRTEGVNLR